MSQEATSLELSSLNATKVQLLAHSKTLLMAAQQSNWQQFAQLEASWPGVLHQAVQQYGTQINSIGAALLDDNKVISQLIEQEQHSLAVTLQKSSRANSAVKQYLK